MAFFVNRSGRNDLKFFLAFAKPKARRIHFNNSAFTPNPQLVTVAGVKSISWPHDTGAVGVTYTVWSSENLSGWDDVTGDAVDSAGTLKYTLPGLTPKAFVRLEVTP